MLFHDVRPEQVELRAHASFVITRVLDRGTLRSVRALLRVYGKEQIRSFLVQGGVSRVSPRTAALWRVFLGITEAECTSKSSPRSRSRFWTD